MKKYLKYLMIGLALVTLAACQSVNSSKNHFDNKVEKTVASGKLKGHKDAKNKAIEWLGIPYAKAPVKKLRWKAPQKVEDWKGTRDVTKAGKQSIQFSNGKVTGSEDALNLDVVRPDNNKKKLPVIVFIHGGNNQTGSAQEIKGNSFVKDVDAVYVSVNYRLGALGFNPLQALKTGTAEENSGNYSLLDIAAALDWVKENVETFGGDKNNITLAGFSAGGRDVMATLISPLFKNKYDKAISFSGGMTLADTTPSQETFAKAIAPLVVEDGVKTSEEEAQSWLQTDSQDVRNYLYKVDAKRLAKLMGNAGIRMSVFPHLYKDGTVIPKEGFATKTYNDVPLMLVTGTDEFSMFAASDPYFQEDFKSGNLFKDPEKTAEFTYAKKYGGQLYRMSNTIDSTRQMDGKYQSNIYVGQIYYGDNAEVTPDLTKTLGSFHGIFEPMLQKPSNYQDYIGDYFQTQGGRDMSQAFKTYLKAFLADGNPNQKGLVSWKPWTSDGEVLTIDATKDKADIKATRDTQTAQDVLNQMDADTSISQESKDYLNHNVLNGRWFSQPIDER
ncbi:carboxylesterase family protein [Streptococcus dentasini]